MGKEKSDKGLMSFVLESEKRLREKKLTSFGGNIVGYYDE